MKKTNKTAGVAPAVKAATVVTAAFEEYFLPPNMVDKDELYAEYSARHALQVVRNSGCMQYYPHQLDDFQDALGVDGFYAIAVICEYMDRATHYRDNGVHALREIVEEEHTHLSKDEVIAKFRARFTIETEEFRTLLQKLGCHTTNHSGRQDEWLAQFDFESVKHTLDTCYPAAVDLVEEYEEGEEEEAEEEEEETIDEPTSTNTPSTGPNTPDTFFPLSMAQAHALTLPAPPQSPMNKDKEVVDDDSFIDMEFGDIFEDEHTLAGPSKAMTELMAKEEAKAENVKDHIQIRPFPAEANELWLDDFERDLREWVDEDVRSIWTASQLAGGSEEMDGDKPNIWNVKQLEKRFITGGKLVKLYARENPELNSCVITTDQGATAKGLELIIVKPEDVFETLLEHPGADVVSTDCGPCFDDVEIEQAMNACNRWYTSTPLPPLQGYSGTVIKFVGEECSEEVNMAQYVGDGSWTYAIDDHVVKLRAGKYLGFCTSGVGKFYCNRSPQPLPYIEHYPGFTRLPLHYSGSFMDNIAVEERYVYLPSKIVNKIVLRCNSTTEVMSAQAMHRIVHEATKGLAWITDTALHTEEVAGRINTSLSAHAWAVNETLRSREEPEWLRKGADGLSQHIIRRLLRHLKPRILGKLGAKTASKRHWTSQSHIKTPVIIDPRFSRYRVMDETPRGQNAAVKIRTVRDERPTDVIENGHTKQGMYASILWKHVDFDNSLSNAAASLINTYHLRATKKQPVINFDVASYELWDDARRYMLKEYAEITPVFEAELVQLGVNESSRVTVTDELGLDTTYPPSVTVSGNVERELCGGGRKQVFNLSQGFLQWYGHLDKKHQATYAETLMSLAENKPKVNGVTLSRPASPEAIHNKVFVKVEIAIRSVAKTLRPRLIQYMDNQYAVHVAPMAWCAYKTWQRKVQSGHSALKFTGGLSAQNVEDYVTHFISEQRHLKRQPLSINTDTLVFAGGDDNLCLLSHRLPLSDFSEKYSMVGRDPDLVRHDSIYSACYCSGGFFRWYRPDKGHTPRFMLLPFKQLEKLGYVKLENQVAADMAQGIGGPKIEEAIKKALGAKAISLFFSFAGCPFMEPIASALLRKTGQEQAEHWSEQAFLLSKATNQDDWYEEHYKIMETRSLSRSFETDESMWASYEFRYGVNRDELLALQANFIRVIEQPEFGRVDIDDPVYGKCLGIDLGSVDKPHSDPAWAEEGLISCIEVDCGSYDASTNAITHNSNISLQRAIFGNHYFIDALDSRREAKLVGDNKFQTLKATARFQMLSGHPDTTFGNTVSNLTEMVASLFHSYPELLSNAEVSGIKVEKSERWFDLAAKMTGGDDKKAFETRAKKEGCHPYVFNVKVRRSATPDIWKPGHTEVARYTHARWPTRKLGWSDGGVQEEVNIPSVDDFLNGIAPPLIEFPPDENLPVLDEAPFLEFLQDFAFPVEEIELATQPPLLIAGQPELQPPPAPEFVTHDPTMAFMLW